LIGTIRLNKRDRDEEQTLIFGEKMNTNEIRQKIEALYTADSLTCPISPELPHVPSLNVF